MSLKRKSKTMIHRTILHTSIQLMFLFGAQLYYRCVILCIDLNNDKGTSMKMFIPCCFHGKDSLKSKLPLLNIAGRFNIKFYSQVMTSATSLSGLGYFSGNCSHTEFHGNQWYTIPCRYVGCSSLLHQQIRLLHSLCGHVNSKRDRFFLPVYNITLLTNSNEIF